MESILIHKLKPTSDPIVVSVPASKSLMNRALVLAALSKGRVKLICGSYGEDTRALISCLQSLGIRTETAEDSVTVFGCGGRIPNQTAEINVQSAGTAARFLTVALAFCGGDYLLTSSEQMEKRPMEVLSLLEESGVRIEYLKQAGHFPFRLHSAGIQTDRFTIDTDKSTQYASGILIAATARSRPITLTLSGNRTQGSYIGMTLDLLAAFGVPYQKNGNAITVFPAPAPPSEYEIEPDLSGACYFYALSLLFSEKVLVRRVKPDTLQGDFRFLRLLEKKGVKLIPLNDGLLADGSNTNGFSGFDENVQDYSDQTMTIAALAPFADSPTRLRGIDHIRFQECDRIRAICENLTRLGVPAEWDGQTLTIHPATVNGGTLESYGDHRIAMAFSLIGLKTGNVTILDPLCCKKTFDRYFDILQTLTE